MCGVKKCCSLEVLCAGQARAQINQTLLRPALRFHTWCISKDHHVSGGLKNTAALGISHLPLPYHHDLAVFCCHEYWEEIHTLAILNLRRDIRSKFRWNVLITKKKGNFPV